MASATSRHADTMSTNDANVREVVSSVKAELQVPFSEWLMQFHVERGCAFTHTSLGKPAGSFYIGAEYNDSFYERYIAALQKGEEPLYLTEKHRHIAPVVIDLDLRFEVGEDVDTANPPRKYSHHDVQEIADVYAEAIFEHYETSECTMYIMEKDNPNCTVQGFLKDGIHIVIPDVVSTPSIQYILRQAILPKLNPIFQRMGATNKIDDIVDEAVIERNNWMMYGARKPGSKTYKVTDVVHYKLSSGKKFEKAHPKFHWNDPSLVETLSIRNKWDTTPVHPSKHEAVAEFESAREEKRKREMETSSILGDENNPMRNTYYARLEDVTKLVEILKQDRADNYDLWIRLGWCLRNIDYRLLDCWNEFSKKSAKFREGECQRLWRQMRMGNLGIRTLRMWAREDNPEEYEKIHKADLSLLLERSLTCTHNDIARVIHHMYNNTFVCSSIKQKYWWEFRGNRWHPSDSGYSLRMHISNEVVTEYINMQIHYSQVSGQTSSPFEQEKCQNMVKRLADIALKLKNASFKESLMRECAELFYIEKFEEKLDSNSDLLCFENGVYDLAMDEFREGRPEDYISFTTNINYIPFNPGHHHVEAINSYLKQVFVNPDVRNYVMKFLSTVLHGSVKEQKFNLWTGSGGNSKSLLLDTLVEGCLGDYCCKFPITLLTQKRAASNAATSELARAKGKRLAVLQEPSEDEKLNIGLMKELSGGDKIFARAIYKEPIEFRPQFKMLLLCNHLPSVPSDDGGTWRRIRVVEFKSKFTHEPDPNNPLEFKIDYELSAKMEHWREHFMSMLIEYYKTYKREGLHEPDEVTQCTRDYQRRNDHYADFVHNHIDQKPNGFLNIQDAFTEFREFLKNGGVNMRAPPKIEFEKNLCRHLKVERATTVAPGVKGIPGYIIRVLQANAGPSQFMGVDELA